MTDDEVKAYIDAKIAAIPGAVRVEIPAAEVIRHEYQRLAVQDLFGRVMAIEGDAREALRFMFGQDGKAVSASQLTGALGKSNVQWGATVKALKDRGYVSQGGASGGGVAYRPRLREWVEVALKPHSATDAEIEDTYQAVLGRLAGARA